ncbi:MAG: RDD family protein [Povalibacter sp.]
MSSGILDTVVSAETPEGIVIELRPAGLTARLYAFLIDQLIRFGIVVMVGTLARFLQGVGIGMYLVAVFALEWFYPVEFELSRWGATPGKRAFKLKVVMDSGLPITPAASITRNLLRFADFLPFMYGFAAISMLVRRDFKRLGDIAAATLVVYEPLPSQKATLDNVEPMAPVIPLSPRDQAAVIALAARAPRMTVDRLDELAALAAAVSGDAGQSGPIVTKRVLAVAQWLLGKRSA